MPGQFVLVEGEEITQYLDKRGAHLTALNLAEDGTFRLVSMRSRFLAVLAEHPELEPVDQDFLHLFRSWFNAGFLKLHELYGLMPAGTVMTGPGFVTQENAAQVIDLSAKGIR